MGGLIARAYLAGLQTEPDLPPPANTLVAEAGADRHAEFRLVCRGQLCQHESERGRKSAELVPGSAFLWNLATWNQRGDDLRGVNTIAIIGNAGSYTPVCPPLRAGQCQRRPGIGNQRLPRFRRTGKSSTAMTNIAASSTRIVPYCHVDPSAFTNTSLWGRSIAMPRASPMSPPPLTTPARLSAPFWPGTTDLVVHRHGAHIGPLI